MYLEMIPACWLCYEPPSLCHTGIETLFALGAGAAEAATVGAAATTAAEIGATVGLGYGGTAAAASALPSLSTIGTAASVLGTGLSIKSEIGRAHV